MTPVLPLTWLDYQRPPPGRQWPGQLLFAAGLILAVLLLVLSKNISDELADTEQRVGRLRQAAEHRRLFSATEKPAAAESGHPVPSSSRRWEALFAALEGASGDGVTLLGLTPGPREITLTGEARGLADALDYVQRLQAAKALQKVHLAKYEIVHEHPRQPVRFTVSAEWGEALR